MRFLLLGGSGFIGAHLAMRLLDEGHEVLIVGRNKTFNLPGCTGAKYLQLDFAECKDFSGFLKATDVVIHLVSTIIPSEKMSSVNQEIMDNVFPTTILLENAAKLRKKVIFISSGGSVYGEGKNKNAENDETNPICNYGLSKLMIEKYLFLYNHFYNLDYRIIRLSNPYSEKTYHGKKQGVIPIVIDNIINGEVNMVWGDGQIRDYIHIDDAIDGIMKILCYAGSERIFNVGSGVGHSVDDVIKLVEKDLGVRAKVEKCPARKCDVQRSVLDIGLIERETGWKPRISLAEGIKKIIEVKMAERKDA